MKNRMGLYLSHIRAIDNALCLMFNRTSQHDWVRDFSELSADWATACSGTR